MIQGPHAQFDLAAWRTALDRFGAVTQLSVALYDANGAILEGPAPATPLGAIFREHDYDPGLFGECVRRCFTQSATSHPAVIVASPSGLSVVGTALLLGDEIVGAAVAGYALVDFCDPVAIARLARQAGVPRTRLWNLVRRQQPVPARRLLLHGELLQVLGDTLMRESDRARQYEKTAAQLSTALAAQDEFLAVLSHELRSPLTPILGWARFLKIERDPVEVRCAAEVIERNAALQLRLVDDLLELNHTTRGSVVLDVKVHCLDEELRNALDAVAESATANGVAVHFNPPDEPLCIKADRERLQQIVRNLLTNALKFTAAGGSVEVTLEKSADRAVVRVRDTGEGIAPEFLPYAFDMFRQQEQGARRAHGGLGVGLALVKRLVDAHGGVVSVESKGVGLGTVVTMAFPIVADTRPPVDPVVADTSDAIQLDGVRALIVDDMVDMRDFLRMTLEGFGAEVFSAGDGVDALGALAREDVHLVLCDLRMPRMDGYEFLRELERRDGPDHVPVIAVSAFASSADHLRTAAAGFEGHLDKPFADSDLLAMVGAVLARRA
jgi:signal transduction histidine kinase/ActR/RegA family two-component response regulator